VADHVNQKKTHVQRVRCFSALSSGLTPPPMKNARRAAAAGHKLDHPCNAAADYQFVGAHRTALLHWTVMTSVLFIVFFVSK